MEIKGYRMQMILLILIIFFSLLVNITKIYEGARSRYSRNENRSELYRDLEKKTKNNNDEIKKINERLDSIGDVTKRINNLERKTKDMP